MMDIRRMIGAALFAGLIAAPPQAPAQYGADYCQILDRFEEPIWLGYAGYVNKARIQGFDDVGMAEAGVASGLFYLHTDFGEVDLQAAVDSVFFSGGSDARLPGHVSAARLDLNYVLRFEYGYALRLGVEPGFYSEIAHANTDHIFYPFSIHGLRSFTPNISGLAGLNFYPGFDRLIDPRLGIRWAISDYMMLDLFYPKTEFVFRPTIDWAFRAGVEIREYLEYQLKSTDDRERLMMDETRIYLGADCLLTDTIQLSVRAGRVVDRNIDFKRFDLEKKIEDAYFVRIGIGGLI